MFVTPDSPGLVANDLVQLLTLFSSIDKEQVPRSLQSFQLRKLTVHCLVSGQFVLSKTVFCFYPGSKGVITWLISARAEISAHPRGGSFVAITWRVSARV